MSVQVTSIRNHCHSKTSIRNRWVSGSSLRTVTTAASVLLGLLVGPHHVSANESAGPGVEDEPTVAASRDRSATIVYGQDYFARYTVTNAEDILQRIPGIASILDEADDAGSGGSNGQGDRRGFGSDGDQVLINGRRLAGKSNEIRSALRRIQIENVDRVELLRGNSNDIDVRSDGVVVNLVLKEGTESTSSGAATLAARFNEYSFFEMDGLLNYNGEFGKLGYIVSLERKSVALDNNRTGYAKRFRDELYFYPTGETMQIRPVEADRDMEEYAFIMNSSYRLDGDDKLLFNALVSPSSVRSTDEIDFTEFDIAGTAEQSGTDMREQDADDHVEIEFGSTFEKKLGQDRHIKLLGVFNYRDEPTLERRNQLVNDALFEVSRSNTDVQRAEAILRGSYYFSIADSQTLEIGAEAAKNTLDQTIELAFDLDGDGVAEEIDIFDPSSEVEESRSEVFANHHWAINERWSVASSLVAEFSRIRQSGVDTNSSTSFEYLKPRIDARFAANPANLFRFVIDRNVSQLNFANFVPRFNVREDRFTTGNPDLRPETAWEYEIGLEHRLDDDEGVVEIRIFYNDIQDRIENVALDLDGDGDFDNASGNIGDATEYGAELSFSVRMSRLGLSNLIVDGGYLWRESSVVDPFTGLERKMATDSDYVARLGIRHDLVDWSASYGAGYRHDGGQNVRSDWTEFRYFERKPEVNAFVEKRFGDKWIVRFDATGLLENKRERHRVQYESGAIDGVVARREYYEETRDRRYTISLTRSF